MLLAALNFPELSPAMFSIPRFEIGGFGIGPLPLRWYALGYIAGIGLAWAYVVQLIKRPALFGGTAPATRDDVDDLIFWIMLGIILGGRLGFMLFYQLPFQADRIAQDPMMLLRVWEGGMSFHGGFLGVCIAILMICRMRKISLWSVADMAALTAPVGIFLVRIANFMNAELYGRHTDSALGMVFPEGYAPVPGTPPAYDWVEKAWIYAGDEMPRHASQLYEAVLEGLLPLMVLFVLAFYFKILRRPGLATGIFILVYACARTLIENFRMPDAHINFLFGDFLTMGMLLSAPMFAAGGWLIWRGLKRPAVMAETKTV